MRQSRPDVGCCAKENNCFVESKVCTYQLYMVFGNHFDTSRFNRVKFDGGNIKIYEELVDQNLRNKIV